MFLSGPDVYIIHVLKTRGRVCLGSLPNIRGRVVPKIRGQPVYARSQSVTQNSRAGLWVHYLDAFSRAPFVE